VAGWRLGRREGLGKGPAQAMGKGLIQGFRPASAALPSRRPAKTCAPWDSNPEPAESA
jgi:hypothetical protein